MGLEREELRALLELRSLPGLNDMEFRGLLDRYGSARSALRAPADELGRGAALRGTKRVEERATRALRLLDRGEAELILDSEPRYPDRLRELADPPPLLFARGRLELLERPALAIVGSRRPTAYGREAARALAGGVSNAGVVVVSGAARGIDGVAHHAALQGGTIAVLGCGIDVVYPREHARLLDEIAARGLILSEFSPGEPPLQYHFPRRNRLIAALSLGVLVVEAARESGSLITVDHATDLGREVMAVPGPIGRAMSVGSNELIRDGAAVILELSDILAALGMEAPSPDTSGPIHTPPALSADARRLWQALDTEPRHTDELAAESGLTAPAVLTLLLELELDGHAIQVPGQRFMRAQGELALS